MTSYANKILHSYVNSPRDVYKYVSIPGGIQGKRIRRNTTLSKNLHRGTIYRNTMYYTAIAISFVTDYRGCAIVKNSYDLQRCLHRIYEANGIVQEITFIDSPITYIAHFETEKFPYYIQVKFLRHDLHKIEKLAKYEGFNLTAISPSIR